jgi:hypothetical protein
LPGKWGKKIEKFNENFVKIMIGEEGERNLRGVQNITNNLTISKPRAIFLFIKLFLYT